MTSHEVEKLKPCPRCGSINLCTDGPMFFEFYGHQHQNESVECLDCGFEVEVSATTDFPCSCHYQQEIFDEIIKRWNES